MAVQKFVLAKKYPSLRGSDYFTHPPNVELLLRHGANPHFRFPDDAWEGIRRKTILEHARDEGIAPKVVQMLGDAAAKGATVAAKADVPSMVAKGKTKSATTVKKATGRLASQSIASAWKQLRATFSQQSPDLRKSLRAKATPKRLAVLKQELGMVIPEQLVGSLEVHDGQTPGAPCLVPREFTSHEYGQTSENHDSMTTGKCAHASHSFFIGCGLGPVFDGQVADATKMPLVVGHQGCIQAECVRRNE